MTLLQQYKQWFDTFTKHYIDSIDDKYKVQLELKVNHTYRVADAIERIAKACKLDDDGISLAIAIGIFHDLGRFTQFSKYKTFADDLSISHGEESVRILKEQNVLKNIEDDKRQLIYNCISNHNLKDIPKEYESDYNVMFYTRMLRDADRIDIYKGMSDILPNLSKEEMKITYRNRSEENYISDNIYNKILNNEKVGAIEAKTIVEAQIVRMSWILTDVYFKEAIRIIDDNNYLQTIYSYMQKSDRLKELYEYIYENIKKELSQSNEKYYDN